jgi:hypothetical protein
MPPSITVNNGLESEAKIYYNNARETGFQVTNTTFAPKYAILAQLA